MYLKLVLVVLTFGTGFALAPTYLDYTALGAHVRRAIARARTSPLRMLEPAIGLSGSIATGLLIAWLLQTGGTGLTFVALASEFVLAFLAGAALTPAPRYLRLGRASWARYPQVMAAATAVLLIGSTATFATAEPAANPATSTVRLSLVIETGAMTHRPGWPKYLANGGSSAQIDLPSHALVNVTLRSYDTGTAPPAASYSTVQGTLDGDMRVDGQTVTALAAGQIAHTFTIPALGVNVPVPAVTGDTPYVTLTFTFRTGAAGTYTWQCYAPCGTGPTGWGGPMITPGFMTGSVVVGG